MSMKRVILPAELRDASDFTNTKEFQSYVNRQMKDKKFIVDETVGEMPSGNVSVEMAEAGSGQSFIEGYVEDFKLEKESKALEADGEEVYLITGDMIDALAFGKPACINGLWISIAEKSEMRLVEGIESRWAEEWGLTDGAQEEK